MREAERKYFDRLGVTVREFVYGDAIERRVKAADPSGVIVHYVKPSSPVAIAGLRQEDWIREIDGVEAKTFANAVAKLAEIEKDETRPEFVMLVGRGARDRGAAREVEVSEANRRAVIMLRAHECASDVAFDGSTVFPGRARPSNRGAICR